MSEHTTPSGGGGDDWAAALAEQSGAEAGGVARAPLDELQADPAAGGQDEDVNLDVILDIPVTLSLEIGRTRIAIRNLLRLN